MLFGLESPFIQRYELQENAFYISYQLGMHNVNADALTRTKSVQP